MKFPISEDRALKAVSKPVLCVGHALVDVLLRADEDELKALGLKKASMCLIDREKASLIEAAFKGRERTLVAGGSAANTAAALGHLGGRCAFLGAVGADEEGEAFLGSLKEASVLFCGRLDPSGPSGRCYVLVSADGERSMASLLGVSNRLDRYQALAAAKSCGTVLFEGYLLDGPGNFELIDEVFSLPEVVRVFSLSDASLIKRRKQEVRALVLKSDLVLCNHIEHQTFREELEDAAEKSRACFVVTHGPGGFEVLSATESRHFEVKPVKAVDATGAGDAFAAGILFGIAQGEEMEKALYLGHALALRVISRVGARIGKDEAEQALKESFYVQSLA